MMSKVEQICDSRDCTGCGACYQKCPKAAISMVENDEGFFNPLIDQGKCIGCQQCIKVCPQNHESPKNEARFYMGWNNDTEVLKTSSSGGIFAALAEYVFKKNGVIFGAVLLQDTRTVEHVCVCSEEELEPLKLSKYYQSNTKHTYKDAKNYLEKGTLVLYSGTACQIAGLYAYLGKDYENLITLDVLCHGVGSKKIVDAYVKSKEHHFRKKVKQIFFRYKDDIVGWQNGGAPE